MRFTIRDVLWLSALAAIGLAWLVDHSIQRARADMRGFETYSLYQEKLRLRAILDEKLPGWEREPESPAKSN
jgi:hypothetical protein